MKVGVYYCNSDIRLEDRPIPQIGDNDILLKVMASGICGSDLMEFHRIKKAPFVPGHELSGIIEKIGKNVTEYKPGERIFVTHHVPCDSCRECQRGYKTQCETFKKINNFSPGGFAPFIKVSGRSLKTGTITLPEEMTYEQATFIEPLGTVVEASETLEGDTVLVFGAGVAGLLNIQLAKAYGAGKLIAIDINEKRLKAAKQFGADFVVNAKDYTPDFLKQVNNSKLADRIIICTGASSATELAFDSYEQGGKIIFFATPKENEKTEIEWYQHWRNGLTTQVTYGATPQSNYTAFSLIKNKIVNVDDMITHRLPLDRIAKGFELATKGQGLKILIKPHLQSPI